MVLISAQQAYDHVQKGKKEAVNFYQIWETILHSIAASVLNI